MLAQELFLSLHWDGYPISLGAMAAPSPRRSTPTPSRRYHDGVGSETDGQWEEEFETASAGKSSTDENVRRACERISAEFHAKKAERQRAERKALPTPLPVVVEEDTEDAQLGTTAATQSVSVFRKSSRRRIPSYMEFFSTSRQPE